jgi:chorismate synthase
MKKKYGIRDYRGGGRSSARETASSSGRSQTNAVRIKINAYVSSVGIFWRNLS